MFPKLEYFPYDFKGLKYINVPLNPLSIIKEKIYIETQYKLFENVKTKYGYGFILGIHCDTDHYITYHKNTNSFMFWDTPSFIRGYDKKLEFSIINKWIPKEYLEEGGYGKIIKYNNMISKVQTIWDFEKNKFNVIAFKEMFLGLSINHPLFLQFCNIEISKNKLFLFSNYKGFTLLDFIENSSNNKREKLASVILPQIIEGYRALHKEKIIYSDIKPENILIDYDNNISIIDYGSLLIKTKANDKDKYKYRNDTIITTENYRSPEHNQNTGLYSDVFSLGCLLYEYFTGNILITDFFADKLQTISEKKWSVFLDHRIRNIPIEYRNVIRNMLLLDYTKRPTLENISTLKEFSTIQKNNLFSNNINKKILFNEMNFKYFLSSYTSISEILIDLLWDSIVGKESKLEKFNIDSRDMKELQNLFINNKNDLL